MRYNYTLITLAVTGQDPSDVSTQAQVLLDRLSEGWEIYNALATGGGVAYIIRQAVV